jgi:uncharacterized protein YcbK (DUF882 family)
MQNIQDINRRGFVKGSLSLAGLAMFPQLANAGITQKSISLYNTHTGEFIKNCTYWENGKYDRDALRYINYILRDYRSNEMTDMNVDLLDYLFDIQMLLGKRDKQIQVVSGYRSESTNKYLRNHTRGVAKKSYHMLGKAIDIKVPTVSSKYVKKAALALARGGVGYYPRSGFVHIDVGPVRTW